MSSDLSSISPFGSCIVILPVLLSWLIFFFVQEFALQSHILRRHELALGQLIYIGIISLYFLICTFLLYRWRNLEKITNIINFLVMASYFIFYLSTENHTNDEIPKNTSVLYWEGMTTEFLILSGTIAIRKLPLKIIFFLGINTYMLVLRMESWEDRIYCFKLAGTLASSMIFYFANRKIPKTVIYSPRDFSGDTGIFKQIIDQSEKGIAVISRDWQIVYKNDTFVDFLFAESDEDYDFKQALMKITSCTAQQDELALRSSSIPTSDQRLTRTTTERPTRVTTHKRSLFGSVLGLSRHRIQKAKSVDKPSLYEIVEKTLKEAPVSILTSHRSTDSKANTNTYIATLSETKTIQIKIRHLEDQEMPTVVLTISDYTLHERVNTLIAAEKMHTVSLASVTHELRAPLTSTIQFLETVSQNADVPVEAKNNNIEPALQNIKYTLILVNDILDFAQIKENKLKLTFAKTNVPKLIEESSAIIAISSKNKKLNYNVECVGSMPEEFVTDANRLKQVLVNLLSNAVKFTMKGAVKLTVDCTSQNWISFSVKDTGIGIKPEDINKLFREYGKIDLGDKQLLNLNGVGLGLNISNKLVKALSDEKIGIQVESKYNRGSIFSFRIRNRTAALHEQQTDIIKSITKAESTCVPRGNSLFRGPTQAMTDDMRSSSYTQLRTMKTMKSAFNKKRVNEEYSTYSLKDKNDRISSYLSSNHIELTLGEKSDEENFGDLANERVEAVSASYQRKQPFLPPFHQEMNFGQQSTPEKKDLTEKNMVYLIDDDQYILMATNQIINNMGIGCMQFFDGEEAMKHILSLHNAKNYPALMLIDYNMPYYTGAELAKMIRMIEKLSGFQPAVIIGLTGAGDNVTIQNVCIESGMDEVYEKPLTKDKLAGILDKFNL